MLSKESVLAVSVMDVIEVGRCIDLNDFVKDQNLMARRPGQQIIFSLISMYYLLLRISVYMQIKNNVKKLTMQ